MDSRERILSSIKKNQPAASTLPDLNVFLSTRGEVIERFKTVLVSIGGAVLEVDSYDQVYHHLNKHFPGKRILTTISALTVKFSVADFNESPQTLADVSLAVLPGQLAVAENGAVWITDREMGDRALPYITEHLALVVQKEMILPTLHDAYERIGSSNYNLGTFIAGPSKTADIEQSLVLGAHGAKSLTVFLMK
jgi:L-lactate dehydrogenase complex protein LldG